ncbi:hypothetical protein Asi03nite_57920 [Actinoplanes siamensis]|uniref:Uncharacterized protein n=1 Tax=Actinoplanes siamensis TaxID=1223317 RepID=A0A919NBR9_9ACTN|nr:hypothetical protein Asi03nite_57920 [Actinoplanes siamensis]
MLPEPDSGITWPTAVTLSGVPGRESGQVKVSPSCTTVAPGRAFGERVPGVAVERHRLARRCGGRGGRRQPGGGEGDRDHERDERSGSMHDSHGRPPGSGSRSGQAAAGGGERVEGA